MFLLFAYVVLVVGCGGDVVAFFVFIFVVAILLVPAAVDQLYVSKSFFITKVQSTMWVFKKFS